MSKTFFSLYCECESSIERNVIKNEIRRCFSIVSSTLINYSKLLSNELDQLSVLESMRILRHLKNLDKNTYII